MKQKTVLEDKRNWFRKKSAQKRLTFTIIASNIRSRANSQPTIYLVCVAKTTVGKNTREKANTGRALLL